MCNARKSFLGFVVVVVVVVDVFGCEFRQQIDGGAGLSRVSLCQENHQQHQMHMTRNSCRGVEASLVMPSHHENITSTSHELGDPSQIDRALNLRAML